MRAHALVCDVILDSDCLSSWIFLELYTLWTLVTICMESYHLLCSIYDSGNCAVDLFVVFKLMEVGVGESRLSFNVLLVFFELHYKDCVGESIPFVACHVNVLMCYDCVVLFSVQTARF